MAPSSSELLKKPFARRELCWVRAANALPNRQATIAAKLAAVARHTAAALGPPVRTPLSLGAPEVVQVSS
jgi:hypothetical protein